MKKQIIYIFLFTVAVSFFSCKNPKEYSVKSDFEGYVQRFEKEAAARGRNFNLKSTGLIIEFADLKDNVAGLCHYEKPIRIEIDKDYWNKIASYAGSDLMREELIFHEMGHGILSRGHTNDSLKNDEWKSIMCGGDSIAGRSWNVNYRGERRTYYLDELFNESAPEPPIVSATLPIDTTNYATVYSENFDIPGSTIWKTGTFADYNATYQNGMIRYDSKMSGNLVFLFRVKEVSVQNDFVFECTIQNMSTDFKIRSGLFFGFDNTTTKSLDYILLGNDQRVSFGNNNWYSYFTQIINKNIIPKGKNALKVVKQGVKLYYFINNHYSYSTEIENRIDGYDYGFVLPGSATLFVDNFRVGLRNVSAAVMQKIKSANAQQIPEVRVLHIDTIDRKVLQK